MSSLSEKQQAYLGLFCYHLNIRPWEWDLLDADQALALCAFVDELEKA